MRYLTALLLAILSAGFFIPALAAAPAAAAPAVGFQHLTIPDPQGPPLEVGIWYPTRAAPTPERLELGTQMVATDAAVAGGRLPLVLMSHGHGGSYAGHVDTAIALAKAGFVAAAVTHSGDNFRDIGAATHVWQRSRHLKLLADYLLAGWPAHGHIDARRIGAFGFSAGGFTVLTAAGGVPDLTKVIAHCRAHPAFEDCRIVGEHPVDPARTVTWTADPRIRAIVSAAPALGFAFDRTGLSKVKVPVQLWRAADDRVLPDPYYAEAVRVALPKQPETHVVPNAGHYDFLAPCSAALAKEVPAICVSHAGFDRTAFHTRFNRAVVAFFKRTLN